VKVRSYLETKPAQELPGVSVRDVITPDDGAPNFCMRIFELATGAATKPHTHWWEHEIFVLSGRGAAVGEKEEIEITKDSVIFTAPYELHSFVNKGNEPLRYVMLNPLPHLKPSD
jgi:quercetin dioxygenase-like cupin family protein